MPAAKHPCPFESKIQDSGDQHVEGRFSRLESEVEGLKQGQASLERTVSEGFRELTRKIDASGEAKSASTLPWVLIWVTLVGIVIAGMTTIFYQALSGLQVSLDKGLVGIASGVEETKHNLATNNVRELDYREAKGKADAKAEELEKALTAFIVSYERQHKELDEKLQKETANAAMIVDTKVNGLDSKIQAEFSGWRKAMDDRTTALAEVTQQISNRQLQMLEGTAEFRGKVNAKQEATESAIKALVDMQLQKLHDYNLIP